MAGGCDSCVGGARESLRCVEKREGETHSSAFFLKRTFLVVVFFRLHFNAAGILHGLNTNTPCKRQVQEATEN